MSVRSSNNYTITPLLPQRAYIGTWDNVVLYATAVISVFTDKASQLVIYQSVDKVNIIETPITITANVPYTNNLNLAYPYIYMTLRNTSEDAQTFLNFEVIYREVSVINPASVGADVNIVSQSAGLALDTSLFTINQTLKGKGFYTLWNNVSVENGNTSQIASSAYATRVLSIFGNASNTATLILQLSINGADFYSTQSQITVNGDFGFSLPCAFYSFRLIASGIDTTSTISAFSTFA